MSLGVSGCTLFFEFEILKLAFRYVATSLYALVYQLLLSAGFCRSQCKLQRRKIPVLSLDEQWGAGVLKFPRFPCIQKLYKALALGILEYLCGIAVLDDSAFV